MAPVGADAFLPTRRSHRIVTEMEVEAVTPIIRGRDLRDGAIDGMQLGVLGLDRDDGLLR